MLHINETGCIHDSRTVSRDSQLETSRRGTYKAPLQPSVATACPVATSVAADVLRDGGNAVDAAVAAAWTLAVCEPAESGIGGQTVMLIWLPAGRAIVVDGTSFAPAAVSTKTVSRTQQRRGYRACTVPTTPRTLDFAQREFGVLTRQRVIEPAIAAAEEGFEVTARYRRSLKTLLRRPETESTLRRLFLRKGRQPYRTGQICRQPHLAKTLQRLADVGVDDFYEGRLARRIAEDMKEHQGLLTKADLAASRDPLLRQPLVSSYRGHTVATTPPSSGGLQLLVALNVLQKFDQISLAADDTYWRELVAATTAEVLRERERWLDHPDDITPSFLNWQLSTARATELAHRIHQGPPGAFLGGDNEPGDTTHVCTADATGCVVTLTQSIQSLFGAKVAHPSLGFVYNNYLYTCHRHGTSYRLDSGCRPKSNIAPTVLFDHDSDAETGSDGNRSRAEQLGAVKLIVGAAGSRRILSSILQVVSHVVDRGKTIREAIAEPRVHGLTSGSVWVERPIADDELPERFVSRFSSLRVKPKFSREMGAVQAILFDAVGNAAAAADPRRGGSATCLPRDHHGAGTVGHDRKG